MNADNQFSFSRDREDILRILTDSKNDGTVLMLAIPGISPGIFITAVDDLHQDGDQVHIYLKKHDVSGFIFERNRFTLPEIISVCPTNSKWENLCVDIQSQSL
jgi:hypothetical protein